MHANFGIADRAPIVGSRLCGAPIAWEVIAFLYWIANEFFLGQTGTPDAEPTTATTTYEMEDGDDDVASDDGEVANDDDTNALGGIDLRAVKATKSLTERVRFCFDVLCARMRTCTRTRDRPVNSDQRLAQRSIKILFYPMLTAFSLHRCLAYITGSQVDTRQLQENSLASYGQDPPPPVFPDK